MQVYFKNSIGDNKKRINQIINKHKNDCFIRDRNDRAELIKLLFTDEHNNLQLGNMNFADVKNIIYFNRNIFGGTLIVNNNMAGKGIHDIDAIPTDLSKTEYTIFSSGEIVEPKGDSNEAHRD